ncbi:hypothetical protein ACVR0S_05570 [Streptococcus dentapri]|uniref:Uncharacterized protein n=2 Tax=Streptococcus dentapri TaxID=573564 RepID=A0ABV8D015_9STRE
MWTLPILGEQKGSTVGVRPRTELPDFDVSSIRTPDLAYVDTEVLHLSHQADGPGLDKISEKIYKDYLSEIREKYSREIKICSNQFHELNRLELDD